MKTKLKKLVSLLFLATVIVSCSKDDEKPKTFVAEDFLDEYLQKTGFNQQTLNFVDDVIFEVGVEFTPLVKGKITTLKVKLPAVNYALRVTIWDAITKTVLRTETVIVPTANSEVILDIVDLELIKGQKYVISMNSNDYYLRMKTDTSITTYPVTTGNIKIEGYKFNDGTSQTYPEGSSLTNYTGDVQFDFLQTE